MDFGGGERAVVDFDLIDRAVEVVELLVNAKVTVAEAEDFFFQKISEELGVGGGAELDAGAVGLGGIHEILDNPRTLPQAYREDASGFGIERAGMSGAFLAAEPFYPGHDLERSDALRLVDIEYAVQSQSL